MQFTKVHGLGNDFIILDGRTVSHDYPALAKRLCHRQTGIGADGLLIIEDSDSADIRMRIVNEDGSEAEMCGNGIRCFARFVRETGLIRQEGFTVETRAGIKTVRLREDNGRVLVRVSMGQAQPAAAEVPAVVEGPRVWGQPMTAAGATYPLYAIRMGVPHAVVFLETLDEAVTLAAGPVIERAQIFPQRTNVNFVQVVSRSALRVDTWERGAGHTLACGTGVCASVWVAHARGLVDTVVHVTTPGGELTIRLEGEEVIMEGGAELICTGEYVEQA